MKAYAGPSKPVVGVDWETNPSLHNRSWLSQRHFDLNPLNSRDGISFADKLRKLLESSIQGRGVGVRLLVQCAGTYGYGPFLETSVETRRQILGLNILGVTELLHAVMKLNSRRRLQNETQLHHILVGSSQGLYARKDRAVYAASKAYGIDFCSSLAEGGDVASCSYLAVGPIDTPMMHRNHWVSKLGGPKRFFDLLLAGNISDYRSVFITCDKSALERIAKNRFPRHARRLLATFAKYKELRNDQFSKDLGVLSASACAKALVRIVTLPRPRSGVYMVTPVRHGRGLSLAFAPFQSLSRQRLFESVAETCCQLPV